MEMTFCKDVLLLNYIGLFWWHFGPITMAKYFDEREGVYDLGSFNTMQYLCRIGIKC